MDNLWKEKFDEQCEISKQKELEITILQNKLETAKRWAVDYYQNPTTSKITGARMGDVVSADDDKIDVVSSFNELVNKVASLEDKLNKMTINYENSQSVVLQLQKKWGDEYYNLKQEKIKSDEKLAELTEEINNDEAVFDKRYGELYKEKARLEATVVKLAIMLAGYGGE